MDSGLVKSHNAYLKLGDGHSRWRFLLCLFDHSVFINWHHIVKQQAITSSNFCFPRVYKYTSTTTSTVCGTTVPKCTTANLGVTSIRSWIFPIPRSTCVCCHCPNAQFRITIHMCPILLPYRQQRAIQEGQILLELENIGSFCWVSYSSFCAGNDAVQFSHCIIPIITHWVVCPI